MTPLREFEHYTLLGEIATGGMGVVYQAVHRGLNRSCALKLIRTGLLATPDERRRFVTEAEAAAKLDHPNIVRVSRAAEFEGQWFLEMELVEGGTLADRLAEGPLPARDTACLLECLARAVQHAHERGILHRDLKPANVLLAPDRETGTPVASARSADGPRPQRLPGKGEIRNLPDQSTVEAAASRDGSRSGQVGQPKLTDFGLARFLEKDSDLTRTVAVLGTPAYLAPELASGRAREATTAADIYSLGVILFECLTGQRPFRGQSPLETLRAVQDTATPRPSSLRPDLPLDLETICLKCLEKEPAKRYATAQALAEELNRYLHDEPIHARPVGRVEKAWRWCRRKPALASFVAATALLLLAILIGSPIAVYRINQARKAELAQLKRTEEESLKARQFAYASDMNLAHQAVQEDDFYRALQLLDRHRPSFVVPALAGSASNDSQAYPDRLKAGLQTDLRGWEWRYLWRQCQGEERFILGEHTIGATAVGLLADGKKVFSAGRDKMVRLWDLESRRQIGLLPHSEEVIGAGASLDGRWLATATRRDAEGQPVLLWDLATQKIAATLTTNFNLRPGSITFSPDNKWLAFATVFGGVRVWDVNARSEVTNLPAFRTSRTPIGLAFSPDSRTLAYNENEYGAILLWDVASRSVIDRLTGHQSAVAALAFSPDGQTLASGSQDRTARLWNVAERREGFAFTNRSGGFTTVAFSQDGRTLALSGAGGAGRVIRLIDVESPSRKAELRGHLNDISSLAFTRDGQTLLSASDDGTVRVWDLGPSAKEKSVHGFARNSISTEWRTYGPALCLSPDGRHLLAVYTNQIFSVWDTLRLAEGERHPLPFSNTISAAVAPGGRLAAFGNRRGEAMLWDAETGQARSFAWPGTNYIHRLVFSLDGRYLATGDDTKTVSETTATVHDPRRTVRVWDVGTRKETHVFSADGEFPVSLAFSVDSRVLLAGFWKGSIKLWPLDGPGGAATFSGDAWWVEGLALLPDGKTLLSAETDGRETETAIRFWDVRTRHENALKLSPRAGAYNCLALSADGRRFAAGASDGRITIWDVASHQEVATLVGHEESVMQLAFTPDGDHLVSVSKDQLRVWRAASRSEADAATEKEATK